MNRALRRARRTWWRGACERAFVVALVVTSASAIASWPFRWLSRAPGAAWSDANLAFTGAVMLVAFLATLSVMLVIASARAPSLLSIARRCDHVLGQRQTISTAFEVLERHGNQPDSVVQRLLLADVDRRLATLDLRRAVREPLPHGLRATLVGLAVTAGLAVAIPVPDATPSAVPVEATSPTTRTSLAPASAEETVELAEAVAAQLANEPIAERDPYLRAVAEGFADLAVRLGEESIDVAEAEQIIGDLLSFLDDAVERTGGSLEDVVREAMPEGIDRGRGEDSNATVPGFGSEATEGEAGREVPDQVDARPPDNPAGASDRSALERLAEALERRAQEREANALEGPTAAFGPEGGNPYGEQVNVARESTGDSESGMEPLMRAAGEGAGRAAGAAQQSSDGAGDAAGGGSAELNGPASDFERDDAQVELTPLEADDQQDGRRIESSFAPTEGDQRDRVVTAAPPERAFDRADENGTLSRTLGWTHRDVVRRYFLPEAAEAAAQSQ